MAGKVETKAATTSFQTAWMAEAGLKGWSKENKDTLNLRQQAFCSVCRQALRAHHGDLIRHAGTPKHVAAMNSIDVKAQRKVTSMGITTVSKDAKETDIQLAVHIAMHSAIRSIDHHGEILVKLGTGSRLDNLKLHRTKFSRIILNVLAPAYLTDVIKDIGGIGYSLIVHESSDITNKKYMAFCVFYLSKTKIKIMTDLVGITQITYATADALFEAMDEYLGTVGLEM